MRSRYDVLGRLAAPVTVPVALVALVALVACGGGDAPEETASNGSKQPASESTVEPVTAETVPDFELALFGNENHAEGEMVSLSDFRGRPVVLNFWFPSCPPCRAEMPDFEAAFLRHKDSGLQFIGVQQVGLDSAQDGQEFIDELGISYAIGPDTDSAIFLTYEITSFPTTYFLDREHNVVRKWQGPLNEEKLEEFIAVLLQ